MKTKWKLNEKKIHFLIIFTCYIYFLKTVEKTLLVKNLKYFDKIIRNTIC